MITIAAVEAKNQWFNLLERVVQGESITILNHGVAVAELVPVTSKRDALDLPAETGNHPPRGPV